MAKAVIKAIEFVRDLRAPMTDLQLMQKYNLSTKGIIYLTTKKGENVNESKG